MEVQLAKMGTESWAAAQKIYQEGGNSKSYALMTLTEPLKTNVPKGTTIVGKNDAGNEVMGKMYDTTEAGNVIIKVQYQTSDIQESYVECQVGALIGEDINMSGCFADGENDIKIGDDTYTYTYTAATDNKAGRTVKGFSTSLQEKLRDGPGAPYPDFTYFYDYYGEYTFFLFSSYCLMYIRV